MPAVAVVVNPHAGRNGRLAARVRRFEEIVGADGVVRITPDLAAIEEVVGELARSEVGILAVCGGDGSHFRTLSAWRRARPGGPWPLFLPLRAGTMNYIARSIGCMPGRPETVLAHVLRDHRQGQVHDVVERHLLIVNDEHAGFTLGAGIVVNFLQLYYASPRQDALTAVTLLARLVASALAGGSLVRGAFRRVEADIDCDDERVPFRTFTVILAGTVTHVALGFKPMYLAGRKRHHFHLLAGPIGPLRLAGKIPRLHRGFPLEDPEFYDNLAHTVTIRFAAPTRFMMDGDLLAPATDLRLTTGPVLSMIRG